MASICLTVPLSTRLKTETQDAHRRVEKRPWVRAFMKGQLPASAYWAHARMLLRVYLSMEEHLLAPKSQQLRDFGWPELARSPGLRADLIRFGQLSSPSEHPAALEYADWIHHVASSEPHLLLAHAYVRYLGDLSGGQILDRMTAKHYGLPPRTLEFYRFEGSVEELKNAFRSALDRLQLSESAADAMLEEARRAFALNENLFDAAFPEGSETSPETVRFEASSSSEQNR